ncbi:MAG: Gfo/Idh/MocA family oxidoreductase [Halodesulfurarchaeum sp.]|nr:Gfo/Idh/MocA family oxidoreductase [Halodesulfurarchaeum sp.]
MGLLRGSGLRAGVIGAGSVAQTAHFPTYVKHPETELVAVADLDNEKRTASVEEFDIDSEYERGEAMLAEEDLDIVSICTPAGTHRDLFVAAAEAGSHIYCEKPFSTDVESAEDMVNAAEAADVVTQVGYTRGYVENYRHVLSMVQNHLLGEIKRLKTHRVRSPPAADWNFDPTMSGGGVVADQLGHILDFYIRLFKTTPDITSVTLERLDVPTIEDFAELHFDFDGVPVETTLHWTPHAKHHRNVLMGTGGLLEFNLDKLTGDVQGETVAQQYGNQPFIDLRGEFRAWWGGSNDFHDRRVWDFVDHAVDEDHDTTAPAQRGLDVTRIIAEVYERGEVK